MAGLGIALRGFGKALKRTFGDPKKTPQYKDEETGKMLRKLPEGNYRGAAGIRFKVDKKGKIK
tara:strand:- start:235 stop:423 length:189 start_codon:yes stop_codon:yes gene_type:complete